MKGIQDGGKVILKEKRKLQRERLTERERKEGGER